MKGKLVKELTCLAASASALSVSSWLLRVAALSAAADSCFLAPPASEAASAAFFSASSLCRQNINVKERVVVPSPLHNFGNRSKVSLSSY